MRSLDGLFGQGFSGQLRFLPASVLPALAGTLLPFWLRPPGFIFQILPAAGFVAAVLLLHLSFILLNNFFDRDNRDNNFQSRRLITALFLIAAALLAGYFINGGITFHRGVPRFIFVAFGLTSVFAGVLYVAPPFSFGRRAGGEIVIAEGLGMLPLIGGYLVQVGDITRTVYMASLPVIAVTGLWIWLIELEKPGEDRKPVNLVELFGREFSALYGVPVLSLLFLFSIAAALYSGSLAPYFLLITPFLFLNFRIITACRNNYSNRAMLKKAENYAIALHSSTCVIIILSSLLN